MLELLEIPKQAADGDLSVISQWQNIPLNVLVSAAEYSTPFLLNIDVLPRVIRSYFSCFSLQGSYFRERSLPPGILVFRVSGYILSETLGDPSQKIFDRYGVRRVFSSLA